MADVLSNNISGIITTEGLAKSIQAQSNLGWKIYPRSFAVSDVLGLFDTTRTIDTMNEVWYEAPISGVIVQNANTLELLCTIPPGATAINKNIHEIYITALDNDDNMFLLGLGQIEGDIQYNPEGTTRLRILISIQNVNISGLYEFKYTQASEIEDHNNDPNAHADIRAILTGAANATIINNTYYSSAGDNVFADTRTNAVTTYLPNSGLTLGSKVTVLDFGLNADKHPITVNRNGFKIDNVEENFIINTSGGGVTFYWYPSTNTWVTDISGRFYKPNPSTLVKAPLYLDSYLNPSYLFQTGGFEPIYIDSSTNGSGTADANQGEIIFANVESGSCTIKLPVYADDGARVEVVDSLGKAGTNPIIISGNGAKINGSTANYILSDNYSKAAFVYDSVANSWTASTSGENSINNLIYQGNASFTDTRLNDGTFITAQFYPRFMNGSSYPALVPNPVANVNGLGTLGLANNRWRDIYSNYLTVNSIFATKATITTGAFTDLSCTNVIQGTALKTRYADLAELYRWTGFSEPIPGTVVSLNLASMNALDIVEGCSRDPILGVISTDPGVILGTTENEDDLVPVALTGRVPVRVKGRVSKGQKIYPSPVEYGVAVAYLSTDEELYGVQSIGMALETNLDEEEKLVMCVIK